MTKEDLPTTEFKIVKHTDTYDYFDCGLHKTTVCEEIKATSWICVLRGTHATYTFDREFIDTRGLKGDKCREDGKFVPIKPEQVFKGAILEVGFKEVHEVHYHEPAHREYRYYEVIDINKKAIKVRIINKDIAKRLLVNPDYIKLKTKVLKAISDAEDIKGIHNALGSYLAVTTMMIEKSEEVKQ
jgi:hypothetical protein